MVTNSTSYQRVHNRLWRQRGIASNHQCETCKIKQAKEWSWVHETDPMDVKNYIPLCVSCHRKYDKVGATSNKDRRKLTDDQVREIRLKHLDGVSLSALGRVYGISYKAITKIINGHTYRDVL